MHFTSKTRFVDKFDKIMQFSFVYKNTLNSIENGNFPFVQMSMDNELNILYLDVTIHRDNLQENLLTERIYLAKYSLYGKSIYQHLCYETENQCTAISICKCQYCTITTRTILQISSKLGNNIMLLLHFSFGFGVGFDFHSVLGHICDIGHRKYSGDAAFVMQMDFVCNSLHEKRL